MFSKYSQGYYSFNVDEIAAERNKLFYGLNSALQRDEFGMWRKRGWRRPSNECNKECFFMLLYSFTK